MSQEEGPPAPVGPPPPSSTKEKKRKWDVVIVEPNQINTTTSDQQTDSQTMNNNSSMKTFIDKKFDIRKKWVGLSNQGATCYLNSLIQTLMMTPQVRQQVYNWKYDPTIHGEDELKCIPLQLQILFASLQFGERNYYETKNLTSSFGWSSRESFIQQDVQELCRVLFEALDKTISNGGKETPISDLYRGNYTDYIKTAPSHEGEYFERSHKADFLDLQLSISDVTSIEEALHKYQEPEILKDDNQWRCEELGNIKVDAIKGFNFNKFPYILTLQLERFGYHPTQFYRIKYSHSVSFPFTIDMNQFLNESNKTMEPNLYELYSVLIHSGGAESGHYFAYIKDFEDDKWYNFNDTIVEEINEEKVKEMFGGKEEDVKKYGKIKTTSTNAYMLMYRKIEEENNGKEFIYEINENIQSIINKDNQEFKKEKEQWMKIKSQISLRFYYQGISPQIIQFKKSSTIKEVTKIVNDHYSNLLKENWKYNENDIRIRDYEILEKRKGRSYIGKEDLTLEECQLISFKSMCIETKESGKEWSNERETYSIYIIPLNPVTLEFDCIKPFQIYIDSTLREVKQKIIDTFKDEYEFDYLFLVKDNSMETSILIDDDKLMENELGVKPSSSIYIEFCKNENVPVIMEQIEKTKNLIEIYFNKIGKEEFTEKVTLDKRTSTLLDLKKLISNHISLSMDSFIVSTKNFKVPYRELKRSITDAGLFDGIQVYIFEGKSLSDNEVFIKLYHYDPNRIIEQVNEDSSTALTKLIQKQQQFLFLGQVAVNETITLKEWKIELAKLVKSSPEKLRIRMKNGPSPGPVITNHSSPLKNIIPGIDNGKHLVVQILEQEEDLTDNDIIIKIQKWSPSEWRLGKLNELIINKEKCTTTRDLKELILIHENKSSSTLTALDDISITKPPMAFEFWQIQECAEVPLFDWEMDSNNLYGQPYLLDNGILILYKNNKEIEKISIEELEKSGHTKTTQRIVESPLRIKTIYDKDE